MIRPELGKLLDPAPRRGSGRRARSPAEFAAFDKVVDSWFDRLRGRRNVDRVLYAASAVGDHGMVWMGIAGLRSVLERNPRAVTRTAAVLAVDSIVVNGVLKSIFRRTRPVVVHPHPHFLRIPRTSSFPSGHATSAFCAASLLADGRPLWPAYYGLAVLVAASRIHVRIHHASDVVAGAVLGTIMGRLARRILPVRESGTGAGAFGGVWPEPSPSTGTTAAPSPATPTSTS